MLINATDILILHNDKEFEQQITQLFAASQLSATLSFVHSVDEALDRVRQNHLSLLIVNHDIDPAQTRQLFTEAIYDHQLPVISISQEATDNSCPSLVDISSGSLTISQSHIKQLADVTQLALKQWNQLKQYRDMDDQLRKTQSRLSIAQKIAQLGNWEWDLATNEVYCSDEIFNILGIPNTRFNNGLDALVHFVHPDDREKLQLAIESTRKNKIPFLVECRILQPQGSEFVVRHQGDVLTDELNEVTHITGIMQNITRSHDTFKQLHLLASALEASADSIIITDPDGTVVWVNPAMTKLSGYRYSELVGETPNLWHSASNDKEIFNTLWDTISSGESWSGELINCRKDGTEYLEEQSITSVFNERGEITHYVAIKRDITKRKETESRNKQAAQVFEHSIEGILISDRNNIITRVNPAFTKITGYSEEEIIGKKPNILRSGSHDDAFFDKMWKAINHQGVWQGEIWNRRKNGEIYPELLTISTLRDSNDQILEYIAIFADITERKQDEEHIHRLAFYDNLTTLPNRSLIQELLKKSLALRSSDTDLVGVMNIDIDRFFSINENMGHEAGDQLLQILAKRITGCNADTDKAARISGDEFTIICTDINSANQLASKAQAILDAIARPVVLNNQEVFVTASIGIAIAPTDGDHVTSLLRNAESARNHAKREGNSYQFFNNEINAQGFEQLVMKSSLRRALERDEFILYYQPQVDIASGKVIGAEALIRWQHPDLGLVAPGQFIPILEETGLIIDIGKWVIKTACEQNKAWQNAGYDPIQISVNLSARQFNQKELASTIESIVDETGIAPSWLELEVTESNIMKDPEYVVETLNQLHNLGIKIAIDDFGTGYSSLSYLKTFPIDVLKIDQSFIRDITFDKDDDVIVKTIISMGHNLGLKIIAEGVEIKDQLEIISRYQCDCYQGYYFSKPVPAAELERLFQNTKK